MAVTAEPWEIFANGVLQAEAVLRRMSGGPPNDLAGLVIGDAEIDRILDELPGLDGPPAEQVDTVRSDLMAHLVPLRDAFRKSLAQPSAFTTTVRRAKLTPDEAEVLALLTTVELGPAQQRLVAYVQDDVSATRVWLSTLERLFPAEHAGLASLADGARLRRAGLVTVAEDGPWGTRGASIPPRLAWHLRGDGSPAPELPRRTTIDPAPHGHAGAAELMIVSGGDRASRHLAAVRELRGEAFITALPPADEASWRALILEATLRGAAVILDIDDTAARADAAHWIERADHLAWAICSTDTPALETLPRRPWVEVRLDRRLADEHDWRELIGLPPSMAHRLDREELRLVASAYEGVGRDLDAAVRRLASGRLDHLAVRIVPHRKWDDLVLPRHQERQLRELVARYRLSTTVYDHWGFQPIPSSGLVALFAGPSGTGKTLAVEVIGNALNLDVYKIDLSTVVSKYIGETEKNLEQIFSAASSANLVLFFDEADAIFGKRSEVADAHDRYANIEVAYLLQRLERYDGVVVMATNLRANIDDAFLRRIHVHVEFREPDEEERLRIWQLSFPPSAPAEELDRPWLAKQFRITGGNIRNAALAAAFFAAEDNRPIAMRDVVRGLDREFEKIGRLRTETDFGQYYRLLRDGA